MNVKIESGGLGLISLLPVITATGKDIAITMAVATIAKTLASELITDGDAVKAVRTAITVAEYASLAYATVIGGIGVGMSIPIDPKNR